MRLATRFSIATASGRGQSAVRARGSICLCPRSFEGVSETRHGKYDECAARGIADTWRDSSAATVNLHEFIEHRIKRGRWRKGGRGEGGR